MRPLQSIDMQKAVQEREEREGKAAEEAAAAKPGMILFASSCREEWSITL